MTDVKKQHAESKRLSRREWRETNYIRSKLLSRQVKQWQDKHADDLIRLEREELEYHSSIGQAWAVKACLDEGGCVLRRSIARRSIVTGPQSAS